MKINTIYTRNGDYLEGPLLIENKIFSDERGFFKETWNKEQFDRSIGEKIIFLQENHSKSKKGVIRGMHYQLRPKGQGKLVRCIHGEIFDVIVDIRKKSKTFGKWFGVILKDSIHKQLWIPIGFAHGFITLSNSAEIIYKTTDYWSQKHERSISYDDPDLNIDWPAINADIIVSKKDKLGKNLSNISLDDLM